MGHLAGCKCCLHEQGVVPGGLKTYQIVSELGVGTLGSRDVDLYRFEAKAGSRIIAETSLPDSGMEMDTGLRLFDAARSELAFNDDNGSTLYSLLSDITLPSDGVYSIGVSGFSNYYYDPTLPDSGPLSEIGSTGDYQLNLAIIPPLGQIRGTVWNDLDGSGVREAGEPGLPHRTVFGDTNGNGQRDVPHFDSADVPRVIPTLSVIDVSGLTGGEVTATTDSSLSAGATCSSAASATTCWQGAPFVPWIAARERSCQGAARFAVVPPHFFAGFTLDETAEALRISRATVTANGLMREPCCESR